MDSAVLRDVYVCIFNYLADLNMGEKIQAHWRICFC